MSDNPTRETHDSRSFEERVFARFDSLDARMDRFESRLGSIENKVDALDARVSRVEAKVDALDSRLTTLEEKVDSRLRETRPIWEAVQTHLENVEARLGGVESELGELKKEVKAVADGVMLLHEDNLRIRIDQRDLRERVTKLESQRTP
jgi:chromosome segregation ATPase